MSEKIKFELDERGVRDLMQSKEMQEVLREQGNRVKAQCGELQEEYDVESGIGTTRAHVNIVTGTIHAIRSNEKHNTLLRALK